MIAGFAVAYTTVKPNLSSTLPGVAIAVALIPPLAVFGIGIAMFNPSIVAGSMVMFLINVVGIVFAGMVTFSLMNVHHKSLIAESTIKREQQRVNEEIQKVKQFEEELVREEAQ